MIAIVDYGMGNLRSVHKGLERVGFPATVTHDPGLIKKADGLVLPGVGAFKKAMENLEALRLIDPLREFIAEGKPFLGICVRMQVLASRGMEFGECLGLGWIPGIVEKIGSKNLPLPHIGWNNISCNRPSPLLAGLGNDPDFYFVHSYALRLENRQHGLASTSYGEEFCSIIQRENIYGVQFHPEKSQLTGMRLVKNFLSLS